MTDKNEPSLFSSMFKKKKAPAEQSVDDELLTCLHNLSAIGEGRDRKVDNEIKRFKKMLQIGSTAAELQSQVSLIAKKLEASSALPENNTLVRLFKKMPAKILVDEFLSHTLSETRKSQLENYRKSLDQNDLASNCISDLIHLFDINPYSTAEALNSRTAKNSAFDKNNDQLKTIINPLLQLFNQIELTKQQSDEYQSICIRSKDMTELNEVSLFVEDASQIILSLITDSSGKFESFLLQLKQRLETVSTFISKNKETNQAISKSSDELSSKMSSEAENIQTSLSTSNEIGELKNIISQRLETISKAISQFDDDRQILEEQASERILDLESELEKTHSVTDHLRDNLQQQRIRALTDQLTKLPNRHAYNERLHLEYNRWRRYKNPLSLIMGDIDLFKSINDTHGHIAGDSALRETAKILQNGIRTTDFAARFGGEEFVILMPETNISDATKVINKIRLSIQANRIQEGVADFKLTMSFGVACFADDDTSTTVLTRADKALYRAKNKGRNQVCVQLMNSN